MLESQLLIVGAGPVGLTLAIANPGLRPRARHDPRKRRRDNTPGLVKRAHALGLSAGFRGVGVLNPVPQPYPLPPRSSAVSNQIVTGPSLTRATFMSAAKRPVSTVRPTPRSASQ